MGNPLTYDEIREETGKSKKNVRKHVKNLDEEGLVEIIELKLGTTRHFNSHDLINK